MNHEVDVEFAKFGPKLTDGVVADDRPCRAGKREVVQIAAHVEAVGKAVEAGVLGNGKGESDPLIEPEVSPALELFAGECDAHEVR